MKPLIATSRWAPGAVAVRLLKSYTARREHLQIIRSISALLESSHDTLLQISPALSISKSDTIIRRWSSAWSWQKRVRDYDAEVARAEFAEAQKAIKKMQERQIQTAMLLQKKAVQALDKLDISELTPQEILRFISEGAKLEAANRAASTQQAAEAGEKKAASIADTIIAAYQRRKEAGDSD